MKRILSGVVAILLSGTAAFAADVYQPPMEPVPEQPVEVIQTSGWYLRGDVGYAWNHLRGANFYQGGPSGSIAARNARSSPSTLLRRRSCVMTCGNFTTNLKSGGVCAAQEATVDGDGVA